MDALITQLVPSSGGTEAGDANRPLSVLIVDDEPLMVLMLERALRELGHKIIATAATGEEGIELARQHQPDLVFLDYVMPGMDGIETAEKLLIEFPVPIIMATGRSDDKTLNRIKGANIHAYLVKPFHREQLKGAISMARAAYSERVSASKRITELEKQLDLVRSVDLAAELLMEKFRIDRQEALEKLETASRARGCTLLEAAKAIAVTLSGQNVASFVALDP